MGPAETYIHKECRDVLKEIEEHLKDHPIGETYFGMKAAKNPGVLATLRSGRTVDPKTIDKLRSFMAERAKRRAIPRPEGEQ